jgi:enoyl-CoA hydratase/carnithine racemase
MAAPLVVTDLDSHILTITVNRPEKRNALHGDLLVALGRAFERARDDRDVRGVLLRGEGKVFSAGVDFMWLASMTSSLETMADFRKFVGLVHQQFNAMEGMEKPIVAAIHGLCVGLALELALACDFRIVTRGATLGLPEVRMGLIPDAGGTTRLIRTVGMPWAKELILTGRVIPAEEAWRIGLANHVVEEEELLPRARALLEEIGKNAPLAVGIAKRIIDRGPGLDKQTLLDLEAIGQSTLLTTEDCREGAMAFMERREPKFQGR